MARIDLGKVKFKWRGDFDTLVAYEADDVVRYAGNVYIFIADHPAGAWTPSHVELMINGQSPVTTQGDLIQGDSGGNEVRLPIGTAGQVLKVDSAGTSAEWANAQPAGVTLRKRHIEDYTAGPFAFSSTSYQWLNGVHIANYTPEFATTSSGKIKFVCHFQKGYVNGHAMLHMRMRVDTTEYTLRSDDYNTTHSSPVTVEFWADGWTGAKNIGVYARAYSGSHYPRIHVPYYMDGTSTGGSASYFAKPTLYVEEWT